MITQENIPYTADEIKAMVKTCEKYNKAREKARELMDKGYDVLMPEIFPELQEDKDERIRKGIIRNLQYLMDRSEGFVKEDLQERIAWLEKQGEFKSNKWTEGDVVRHGGVLALVTNGRKAMKSNCEQITIQYPDEWVKAEAKERKHFFDELEKQGGQKSVFEMKTPEESLGIDSDTYNKIVDECIYGDQKPADKVEPKFHEGEWITSGYDTWEIVGIKPLDYILQSQEGNIVDDTISYIDKHFHSFTIEDAKDGDVLVSDEVIFIFNKIHDVWVNCHCSLHKDGSLCEENYDLMHIKYAKTTYPATKKQRDLFSQKMKEAGYEWDSEKKELKKIEPKILGADDILPYLGNNQVQDILEDMGMLDDNGQCSHTAEEIFKAGMEHAFNLNREDTSSVKLDADKVIAWLVANICDFEYYVKLFKKDFKL